MIIICLAIGWCAIILYNIKRGYRMTELLKMSWNGILGASNVLLMLATVGMLTGTWRASGTIAYIVTLCMGLISPRFLLISIFLLNCLVSFLIGTSFGTSATMGVISMIVANACGLPTILSAGAVMSGIFFGDRCSPISSSAMLVADVTETDILSNIKRMMRSAFIPWIISCLLYLAIGMACSAGNSIMSMDGIFDQEFHLTAVSLLPVVIVFSMVMLRCNVKLSMLAGCLAAGFLYVLQGHDIASLCHILIFGFQAKAEAVARMMDGGGLLSMKRVLGIVCLSSTYAGLIKGTGFADGLKNIIGKVARKLGNMISISLVSIITCMIGCNQTLAIMLTKELCADIYEEKEQFALDLEDSVVLISALIPWCIAGAVPIATIGAPTICLFTAFYLYLVPTWRIVLSYRKAPDKI